MIWTRETVESTAEVVDRAADEFEHKAAELRRMAKAMREEGDLSIAGEAIGTIVSLANIRVLRPRPAQQGGGDRVEPAGHGPVRRPGGGDPPRRKAGQGLRAGRPALHAQWRANHQVDFNLKEMMHSSE